MDFPALAMAAPALWSGLLVTLQLTVLAVAGGTLLGTLLALLRLSRQPLLAWLAAAYVNLFRAVPLLLVIIWFYLAVPLLLRALTGEDTPVGAFGACLVAFILFEAAFFCEVVRAGIQSIPRGQFNAALALGLTPGQSLRRVILPQAFRNMLPLLLQQSIILFQDTSLVYAVGLGDFLNTTRTQGEIRGELHPFLLLAGLVYFLLSLAASRLVRRLQTGHAR